MESQGRKQIKFVMFLMFGALFCSIMVAVTKLIGADDYTGIFAIAAVGFAIVTIPFSIVVPTNQKKDPVSRVDLLKKRYLDEKPLKSE
ncbi:MAG: hypothetical protein KAG20_03010 [Cocleimonas sp.]|nr:hypothetical protein [Cocleimonas sp.]